MRLQRVQIPNFRVLKDIDITFEDYHIPQIFLLASQNGGGKSTFLQLIFILLNFYGNNDNQYIKNLLMNSRIGDFTPNSILAIITLLSNENVDQVKFEFHSNITFYDKFLTELSTDENEYQVNILREIGINKYIDSIETMRLKIQEVRKKIEIYRLEQDELKEQLQVEMTVCSQISDQAELSNMLQKKESTSNKFVKLSKQIDDFRKEFYMLEFQFRESKNILLKVNSILDSQMIRITYHENDLMLICQSNNNMDLNEISKQVFMAAPSSQIFLFLSPSELSSLFLEANNYHGILNDLQATVNNLFLYEFSMVKILGNAFKKAFENDRVKAIRSGGKYGNEFELLLNELKDFFGNKNIKPSEDLLGVVIKEQGDNNQEIELNLTDLSHGELRRLSIYAWLKTKKIRNSIILVDEIEVGFHPDWQYQIVRDLEVWEPSNQYILATHSYDVCSALSPTHVKEIEPKLLKSNEKVSQ
jgi:predicted ATP-binding protein involved in virulence